MDFIKNLANLIKVKTIVTLIVILVFAVLALRGDISPDNVMNVVLIVIGFYFGTQFEQKVAAKNDVKAIPVEAAELVTKE